jgi:hypothetical protein
MTSGKAKSSSASPQRPSGRRTAVASAGLEVGLSSTACALSVCYGAKPVWRQERGEKESSDHRIAPHRDVLSLGPFPAVPSLLTVRSRCAPTNELTAGHQLMHA